jgi:hypothetical protein
VAHSHDWSQSWLAHSHDWSQSWLALVCSMLTHGAGICTQAPPPQTLCTSAFHICHICVPTLLTTASFFTDAEAPDRRSPAACWRHRHSSRPPGAPQQRHVHACTCCMHRTLRVCICCMQADTLPLPPHAIGAIGVWRPNAPYGRAHRSRAYAQQRGQAEKAQRSRGHRWLP